MSTLNQFRFSTNIWEKRLWRVHKPSEPRWISHHSCCTCSSMHLGYFIILLGCCNWSTQPCVGWHCKAVVESGPESRTQQPWQEMAGKLFSPLAKGVSPTYPILLSLWSGTKVQTSQRLQTGNHFQWEHRQIHLWWPEVSCPCNALPRDSFPWPRIVLLFAALTARKYCVVASLFAYYYSVFNLKQQTSWGRSGAWEGTTGKSICLLQCKWCSIDPDLLQG